MGKSNRITEDQELDQSVENQEVETEETETDADVEETDRIDEEDVTEEEPEAPPVVAEAKPKKKAVTVKQDRVTEAREIRISKVQNVTEAALKDQHRKEVRRWQAILDKQPKVLTMIPLMPGEKPDAVHEIGFNGCMMILPKGKMLAVPKVIGEMISESYRINSEIGQDYLIDNDPDKKAALS